VWLLLAVEHSCVSRRRDAGFPTAARRSTRRATLGLIGRLLALVNGSVMISCLISRVAMLVFAGLAMFVPERAAWSLPPSPTQSAPKVQRHLIGGPGGWDFLTFDSVRKRVFITRGDRVQVWDVNSRAVVAEIAGTAGVHGVALAQDLNRGFTSNGRANTVSVFGLDDLRSSATIAIPGQNPDAILYVPALKRVFAFNGRSKDVTVIDAVSLAVMATIPLGGKPEVAVASAEGRVFVNIEDTGEVVVLDPSGSRIEKRWPLKPCEEPTGLALDAARQRLFSVCANHMMVVVDSTSGRLVAHLPIGAEPDGAEFDPASGRAFSANGEGTLTVVQEEDAEHFGVVATIVTQPRARTLALDPVSQLLYLVTASFGPPPPSTAEQPRPRAPMVKDTFTLLVVDPN
jgi:YVTN family beta-propeller protein